MIGKIIMIYHHHQRRVIANRKIKFHLSPWQRFIIDHNLLQIIKHFVQLLLHTNTQDIQKFIAKDIDLQELTLESKELLLMKNIHQIQKMNLNELFKTLCILCTLCTSPHFINFISLFTRILVAKPLKCGCGAFIKCQ